MIASSLGTATRYDDLIVTASHAYIGAAATSLMCVPQDLSW